MTQHYDVMICGAGPAGSSTAYFIKTKLPHLRVCLLDKAQFPRDKYCGDAYCAPALDILEEMGVLQDLEQRGLINNTLRGGFVSPSGYSFIANDSPVPGAPVAATAEPKNMATRAYAIKRMICDEAMALKAKQVGCELLENSPVEDARLDYSQKREGVWTVHIAGSGSQKIITCTVLIAADGAASALARKLGVVHTAPDGVAARQYIKPGTHNFKADGVLLYPEYTLPGYMALFRHYDGSIDLGAYLLPGGAAKEEDIADIYANKIRTDPFIARALGNAWEPLERVKVASLRLGGVPQSYGERFFLVGDAAGHIDPLTGEGIHLGMMAAKMLAGVVRDMFQQQRFTIDFGKRYHEEWMRSFGDDFPLSRAAGKVVFRVPYLMDAVPIAAASKGEGKAASEFFADFGAVMTGVKPKSTFLLPWVAWPMFVASVGALVRRARGVERTYFQDERARTATSFDTQCLIDPDIPFVSNNGQGQQHKDGNGAQSLLDEMFAWPAASSSSVRRVLVAYGTEYGLSKEVAQKLCAALHSTAIFVPRMVDLEHYQCVDFAKESLVFVVCSTAGDGEFPVRARAFFDALPGLGALHHVKACVLACGDSGYPKFCEAGRALARALQAQGASWPGATFCQDLDGDNTIACDKWIAAVVAQASSSLTQLKLVEEEEDYLVASAQELLAKSTTTASNRATKSRPFMARIKSKTKLTQHPPCEWTEDKWHIVLDVAGAEPGQLDYLAGDALGVLPQNDPREVDLLLNKLQQAPSRSASTLLMGKNLADGSNYKMLQLAKAGNDDLKARKGWIADWLPSAPQAAVDVDFERDFKSLQPRFYSICSSPVMDKGEIHLCVAGLRYESGDGRKTGGVASTYLIDRVKVGDQVPVFVQVNSTFRASSSEGGRQLLIGPGTGVAPFRAFCRDATASATATATTTKSWLFFGCRYEHGDFLYGDEWKALAAAEEKTGFELSTAFSRADHKQRVYVQHRLAEQGAKVWRDYLQHDDCQVYICGDGFNMASDVEAALVRIVKEHKGGELTTEEEALQWLKPKMHLDVWVV